MFMFSQLRKYRFQKTLMEVNTFFIIVIKPQIIINFKYYIVM